MPRDFWGQIRHQLARIAASRLDTFDAIRCVLLDPAYDCVIATVNLNGVCRFDDDTAFFAGSGGDESLGEALMLAGWRSVTWETSYYYVMKHGHSAELLTYIEGDVIRGNAIDAPTTEDKPSTEGITA